MGREVPGEGRLDISVHFDLFLSMTQNCNARQMPCTEGPFLIQVKAVFMAILADGIPCILCPLFVSYGQTPKKPLQ